MNWKSIFICVVASLTWIPAGWSAVHEHVLNTVWNQYQPDGKEIEFKNIDVIELEGTYGAISSHNRALYVYLWVKRDLGRDDTAARRNIRVIDKDQLVFNDPLFSDNSEASIRRVGIDPKNGYYVYRYDITASLPEHTCLNLYAVIRFWETGGYVPVKHYSNEGHEDQFFSVCY